MEVRPKNSPSICPVCRDPIGSSAVIHCPMCGQAYHSDCWSYNNNQCGVLGCGGRTLTNSHSQNVRHPRLPFVGVVGVIGILCVLGSFLGGLVLFPALISPRNAVSQTMIVPSRDLGQTDISADELITPTGILTSTPLASVTASPTAKVISTNAGQLSNQPVSPEQFITNYFSAINNRQYDLAWAMLSKKFQTNQTYSEYTSWWNTVEKVEILSIKVRSKSSSDAFVYVEAHYYYKSGDKTTGHTTYKLVKNETGDSWLFDPN